MLLPLKCGGHGNNTFADDASTGLFRPFDGASGTVADSPVRPNPVTEIQQSDANATVRRELPALEQIDASYRRHLACGAHRRATIAIGI
jgi:hypothetical protein